MFGQQQKLVRITVLSALLFIGSFLVVSISPLHGVIPQTTKLGSNLMWLTLIVVILLYVIPTLCYFKEIKHTIVVLAFLCAGGFICHVSMGVVAVNTLLLKGMYSSLLLAVSIVSLLAAGVNVWWFKIAFYHSFAVKQ
ncbi:integral inner membrane protein [Fictibacillus macauensis ZFHKF-1]|uniref:Integral inner membrane protein n=1 Tax=Fictibacillus macauensis ZFHKF-1 TaxID=1196324 RepID=I8AM94_9BACL|nr:DUF5391 family protein [Fictibacillus macauensis]EIT87077.1 integral inner membrane protein [Fictibacillus macauensis ZFHKF-1]